MSNDFLWWQRGIIYQVYPRSFMDSNGDGVGDLPGIASKLDYLTWLGVDALWLSPIYPSPMADFGYDVADYTGVDPLFGTLKDFDALLEQAHGRGLKVMLDFVPNHTSDEHPWFVEARSARDNPRRDWYIWRDAAPGGGPPNNWLSYFGGSAWEWDAASGQYYLHLFHKKQPDLNWRNPAVQAAMLDAMRFWLDRGVDGFRVDVLWLLIKDEQFRNNLPNPDYIEGQRPLQSLLPVYSADRPEIHNVVALMRRVLDEYPERMMVGEIYLPIERLVTYYGANGLGAHLPFNFQLIGMAWNARVIGAAIDAYEAALPPDGWPNWVLGNHDQPRIASRIGARQARVAAMLLLTLRGTPTMYYGDELGMHDVAIPPELAQDPQELGHPGMGIGRDPERTPMQWDSGPSASFTTASPWLPVAEDYETVNVAAERDDPRSMLALYRQLIALRRANRALEVGSYAPVPAAGDVLAYVRAGDGRRFLIALNLGRQEQEIDIGILGSGRVALSTQLDRAGEPASGSLRLRGDEGVIVELA
jgi:alpha-glucosidase